MVGYVHIVHIELKRILSEIDRSNAALDGASLKAVSERRRDTPAAGSDGFTSVGFLKDAPAETGTGDCCCCHPPRTTPRTGRCGRATGAESLSRTPAPARPAAALLRPPKRPAWGT
jgi:hypothetical protein